MERNQGMWLEWFCNFVQEDLSRLPIHERIKLTLEIATLLAGTDWPERPDQILGQHIAEALKTVWEEAGRDNLESFKEALKPVFDGMMANIKQVFDFVGSGPKKVPLEATPLPMDDELNLHIADFRDDAQLCLLVDFDWNRDPNKEIRVHGAGAIPNLKISFDPAMLDRASLKLAYKVVSPTQYLVRRLHEAMNGVPLKAFCKCPECGKWFVHLSKREKQFCSNRCASRYGIREKRKEAKRPNDEGR